MTQLASISVTPQENGSKLIALTYELDANGQESQVFTSLPLNDALITISIRTEAPPMHMMDRLRNFFGVPRKSEGWLGASK